MGKDEKKITIQQMRELVKQESWVKTPYRYTQLGAGLSLIQQQALLMVSGHLQSYIKDFYNLHLDKSKKRPKALFSEHVLRQGIPPMKIWLADLGVQPNNYKEARRAIDEINLQVEHPELDSDGNPTGKTLLTNVFSQFGFEETGEYYHFDDPNAENGRGAVKMKQPYIDVKINPDVAEWAFDMSQGYVNHLKMIASYSSKRPTPRLYLMLMNRTKKGEKTVTILLTELKEYLGIMPYKNEKGETVTPYPKFANFRQKVLDAVQADLERMAGQNPPKTDITFTYELVYPGSRKKGDPESIMFHVERTILGDAYNVVVNHAKFDESKKPVQQELFTEAELATETKETLEPGTGTELWQKLLQEYDGPAKQALHEVTFLGLDDGVFSIIASIEQREAINTLGDGDLYRMARLILGMSETSFRPPIIMRKG